MQIHIFLFTTYISTYVHSMNPEVCQSNSRMWNKSETYKCTQYTELLQYKILARFVKMSCSQTSKVHQQSERSMYLSIFLMVL